MCSEHAADSSPAGQATADSERFLLVSPALIAGGRLSFPVVSHDSAPWIEFLRFKHQSDSFRSAVASTIINPSDRLQEESVGVLLSSLFDGLPQDRKFGRESIHRQDERIDFGCGCRSGISGLGHVYHNMPESFAKANQSHANRCLRRLSFARCRRLPRTGGGQRGG